MDDNDAIMSTFFSVHISFVPNPGRIRNGTDDIRTIMLQSESGQFSKPMRIRIRNSTVSKSSPRKYFVVEITEKNDFTTLLFIY